MKRFLSALLLLCAFTMNAQTVEVSGNQSGTWSGDIHIVGDVYVGENETLTVEPGTSVVSDGFYVIFVKGGFVAEGTADEMIMFTVADTTGYSDYETIEGSWGGIHFEDCTDEVSLDYCDISYAKTKPDRDGAALRFYNAGDVEISNCDIHHNTMRRKGGAIYAENTEFYIHDCEVYNNEGHATLGNYCWGTGFQFLKCDIEMHDMVFHDNFGPEAYGGGMNVDSCNLQLRRAVFYDNMSTNAAGLGIQRCKKYTVKVSDVLAYNNTVVHYGGGIAMATSDPEINNVTLVANHCGGGGGAGMQMAFDSAPTISNSIIFGNRADWNEDDYKVDSIVYYYGSQIWLWGDDCRPYFYNSTVQYGLDTIYGCEHIDEDHYVDMIEANPLFVNSANRDYRLTENSPCINTGRADTTGMFLSAVDLAGGPRIFEERIDMGCFEWNNIGINEVLSDENSLQVYPNPLSENSICSFNLKNKCEVAIVLISLDGKEVARKECGTLNAGQNSISLDGLFNNLERKHEMYLLIIENQGSKNYKKVIY